MAISKAYRARNVESVKMEELLRGHESHWAVVGVDVGKGSLFMVVRWSDGTVERPVVAKQPCQLGEALAFLRRVAAGRKMKVALEPTGTYGDPLRYGCYQAGLEVLRISPVISRQHAEVYDGVASQHDGKDAAVLAELGSMGKGKIWAWEAEPWEAELSREVEMMDWYQEEVNAWRSRLEAKLARHWPEAGGLLELDSATLLEALVHYGSPAKLSEDQGAAGRLKNWGGRFLTAEKVSLVLASAQSTRGVPMCPAEMRGVCQIARRLLAGKKELGEHHQALERLSGKLPETALAGEALGKATVAVLHAEAGDPGDYPCARAYQKGLGLNLKERSSGKYVGRLKITKRGSSRARRWLYLAALRLVCQSEGVRAWYEAKVSRDGGKLKGKALVAIMRKIAAGLVHCRRTGEVFDPELLFPGAAGRRKAGAAADPGVALPKELSV